MSQVLPLWSSNQGYSSSKWGNVCIQFRNIKNVLLQVTIENAFHIYYEGGTLKVNNLNSHFYYF